MYLPSDIYDYISEHLSPSTQPAFRRANSVTAAARFDWRNKCCEEPTIPEIADWLWEQHLLLSNPATRSQSNLWADDDEDYLTYFPFLDNKDSKQTANIVLNAETGELYDSMRTSEDTSMFQKLHHINSRNELGRILYGKHLIFDSMEQLWMLRDIFRKRISCMNFGVLPDQCHIKYLANHLSSKGWKISMDELYYQVHDETFQKFLDELVRQFNIPHHINVSEWFDNSDAILDLIELKMNLIPPNVYSAWLKRWILNLRSEDLVSKIVINNHYYN